MAKIESEALSQDSCAGCGATHTYNPVTSAKAGDRWRKEHEACSSSAPAKTSKPKRGKRK